MDFDNIHGSPQEQDSLSSPEQNSDSDSGDKMRINSTHNGYGATSFSAKHDGQSSIKQERDDSGRNEKLSKHHSDHTKHDKRHEGQVTIKKESQGSIRNEKLSKHHSDHVKQEPGSSHSHRPKDSSKHKSSGHSTSKEGRHSDHTKNGIEKIKSEDHSSNKSTDGIKKEEKMSLSKDDKLKMKHKQHSSSSDHKKPKDKQKHELKDKSGEKHKDKGEKPKDKSDKPKERSEKPKDRHDKPKDKVKGSEKPKSSNDIVVKQESGQEKPKVKKELSALDKRKMQLLGEDLPSPPLKKLKSEDSNRSFSSSSDKPKGKATKKKRKSVSDEDDYSDDDYKKPAKKAKATKAVKKEEPKSPTKRKAKKEEEQEVWKWWEEEKHEGGVKWRTLEHNGPVFAPAYERVPKNVKFYYDGKPMELSEVCEEVAGFYGRMLDHEYTTKESFNKNFFKDWKKVMTPQERDIIKDLKKCNFKDFNEYYKLKSEERKAMTKEEKLVIKKQNEELTAKYGFCIIDGHKQKIGNFKIEPPGLFRGRGEHPKMGMLKRRVKPEDILINIGKDAKVPKPPDGHKWKEVRHDSAVTWLASWNENILNSTKYIMLNPSSKLKGEKDWQKYETARKLKNHADRIRKTYTDDFKSKEMRVRQRAVALYFIDKLALRAGNEKDEDTADTVGCCSLRVEHISLDEEKDGQQYVVSFDFLGKDSIRYFNTVAVEKRAFKNVKLFMENKQPGDDLFDRLNTGILNKYLNELMEGLTAKVFRTYNASKTLQEQLDLLTKEEMSIPEKILAYNRANRAVAVLCNHQRAVPKTFDKSMENLKGKIDEKLKAIKDCKKELKQIKNGSSKDKVNLDKKKKRLKQLEDQLQKLEVLATDKEENKQIALGTSKLNYLDPRISVAWSKKWNVPIEKIYNRTQRDKFRWAIEMAGPEFVF